MYRVLLPTIGLLLSFISVVQANSYKEVRDWYVYCDNDLKCSLQTAISGGVAYTFGIERGPQANADLVPFLSLSGALKQESAVEFVVSGVAEDRFLFKVNEGVSEESTLYLGSPEKARALLEAMMAGSKMVLSLETDDGPREVDVSLSGVTAGAIFMDDMQQRIGNRDALKETGEGEPKDAFTRARDLRSLADLPSEVASFWKIHTDGCAETFGDEEEDLVERFGGVRINLKEDAQLYLLPCGLPGTYNYPQSLLMFDTKSKAVRQMSLPIMGQNGPTVMDHPYNVNWDDRASTLSAFFKGRGLGDCGSKMSWILGGEGYYANFELKEAFFKDECDGNYEDWPRIWPLQ